MTERKKAKAPKRRTKKPKKVRLKLVVTIDYECSGATLKQLKTRLKFIVDELAHEEQFTDALQATVLEYPDVEIIEEEPELEAKAGELLLYVEQMLHDETHGEEFDVQLEDEMNRIFVGLVPSPMSDGRLEVLTHLIRKVGYEKAFKFVRECVRESEI